MLGHNALSLVATVIMLDQHWLSFSTDINDLTDDDLNCPTIGIGVRLSRLAPAAIQQDACRRHARCRWPASWLTIPASTLMHSSVCPRASDRKSDGIFFRAKVYG